MGHYNFRSTKTAHSTSHPEWLAVSAAIGRMVNFWSGRYDVAAFAGPGAGEGHPAFFNPNTSEVEVNIEKCFGPATTPAEVANIDQRSVQFEWPRATGAILHESLHARYSFWSLIEAHDTLTPAEFNALVLLEEGRIEALGIKALPGNELFLRTMALEIVLDSFKDINSPSDTVLAGNIAALSLARVDAGVLTDDDVASIRDLISEKLGESTLEALRELWLQAQSHNDASSAEPLYEIAREWVRVINSAAVENGEPDPGAGQDDADELMFSRFGELLGDMLDTAAADVSIAVFDDLADQQMSEEWKKVASDKASQAKDRKDAEKIASDVFSKGTQEMQTSKSGSSVISSRAPSGDERAAAVIIARQLDKAKYRDRDATEISSVVPPGRLRTRAAMQAEALKSKGAMATAEPWRRTVRKHTDDPTLSIGVMVDISGSMGDAMQPMAVAAWALSEAVRRVQGRAAMVYYGSDAFPTLKPGQHLSKVTVWSAPDGTEKFDLAFKAVNGSLNLLWGTGARLLVVVSDGCYTSAEQGAARQAMQQCQSAGVGVLWLNFSAYGNDVSRIVKGTNTEVVYVKGSISDAATAIGSAAAKALTSAAAS